MILFQEGKTLSRSDHHVTAGRLQFSGENLQEGRLAGTIGTDQTVAVSFSKFDVYIFEKSFFADPKSNVICTNHCNTSVYQNFYIKTHHSYYT